MAEIARRLKAGLRQPMLVPRVLKREIQARASRYFTDWLKGWSAPPETVNIYPTARCNLNCAMCFIRFTRIPDNLGLEFWKEFVDQLTFLPRIHLSGGEPLLFENIDALVAHIKARGLFLHITTNGTLLAEHAEALVREKVDQIEVSLDGPAETHDRLRGVAGTFDRVINGLQVLRRRRSHSPYPRIKINSIINFEQPARMSELVRSVMNLGVSDVQFIHPLFLNSGQIDEHRRWLSSMLSRDINCWRHADRYPVMPGDISPALDVIERLRRSAEIRITVFPDFRLDQADAYYHNRPGRAALVKPRCAAMWNTATVLANADLESCPDYVVGNCRQTAFLKLWNSEPMRALRHRIRRGHYFSVCRACCFYYQ